MYHTHYNKSFSIHDLLFVLRAFMEDQYAPSTQSEKTVTPIIHFSRLVNLLIQHEDTLARHPHKYLLSLLRRHKLKKPKPANHEESKKVKEEKDPKEMEIEREEARNEEKQVNDEKTKKRVEVVMTAPSPDEDGRLTFLVHMETTETRLSVEQIVVSNFIS